MASTPSKVDQALWLVERVQEQFLNDCLLTGAVVDDGTKGPLVQSDILQGYATRLCPCDEIKQTLKSSPLAERPQSVHPTNLGNLLSSTTCCKILSERNSENTFTFCSYM